MLDHLFNPLQDLATHDEEKEHNELKVILLVFMSRNIEDFLVLISLIQHKIKYKVEDRIDVKQLITISYFLWLRW